MNLENNDCLVIHGTGYIGFWYSYINLLKNSKYLDEKVVYCYSSGCLSILAYMNNYTFDQTLQISNDIKQEYKNNVLDYHQVRYKFISLLINSSSRNLHISNLKIVIFEDLIKCSFNTPKNQQDWFDYLIKTTHIPYLTSKTLSLKYLDGAFCIFSIPRCKNNLIIPFNYLSFKNVFNPDQNIQINLSKLE